MSRTSRPTSDARRTTTRSRWSWRSSRSRSRRTSRSRSRSSRGRDPEHAGARRRGGRGRPPPPRADRPHPDRRRRGRRRRPSPTRTTTSTTRTTTNRPPAVGSVEAIFARLRASNTEPSNGIAEAAYDSRPNGAVVIDLGSERMAESERERTTPTPTPHDADTDDTAATEDDIAGVADVEEIEATASLLDQRDEVLATIERAVGRRLKRALSDQENAVLDRLQRDRRQKVASRSARGRRAVGRCAVDGRRRGPGRGRDRRLHVPRRRGARSAGRTRDGGRVAASVVRRVGVGRAAGAVGAHDRRAPTTRPRPPIVSAPPIASGRTTRSTTCRATW